MIDIVRVHVLHVAIPFRFSFKHALKDRDVGDGVLVVATDAEGRVGHGESAPRPYVTGETAESVAEAIEQDLAPRFLGRSHAGFEDLRGALEDVAGGLDTGRHAAFCALELALLDLGGKAFGVSAGEVCGPRVHEEVVYSGIVSADGEEETRATCALLRQLRIRAVKAKVGREREEDDLAVLRAIRDELGDEVSLRVDANCAWDADTALRRLDAFAPLRLDGLEQPCPPGALDDMARVTRGSEVPVIADESLCSLDDARRLVDAGACDLFNLRVSKCGGLILSTRLRDLADEAGIGCMLGAQVGETAILSAAGRHLALRSEDLRFHEGSYGTHLLREDVSDDTALGAGGRGGTLEGLGLGVRVDLDRVGPYLRDGRDLEVAP